MSDYVLYIYIYNQLCMIEVNTSIQDIILLESIMKKEKQLKFVKSLDQITNIFIKSIKFKDFRN